ARRSERPRGHARRGGGEAQGRLSGREPAAAGPAHRRPDPADLQHPRPGALRVPVLLLVPAALGADQRALHPHRLPGDEGDAL
ncbi:MAG: FIG00985447: hypothetical protein, partial [uncultured Solirubrobacteraceae bacterium]